MKKTVEVDKQHWIKFEQFLKDEQIMVMDCLELNNMYQSKMWEVVVNERQLKELEQLNYIYSIEDTPRISIT
ncbi:hypothetical protein [Bacillus sp. NPDC094106]|uniref:hypothetical protein n=1 Tax=Bacillus sp. NPDC094106 TaxID=3363949 RepID=UPI0038165E76